MADVISFESTITFSKNIINDGMCVAYIVSAVPHTDGAFAIIKNDGATFINNDPADKSTPNNIDFEGNFNQRGWGHILNTYFKNEYNMYQPQNIIISERTKTTKTTKIFHIIYQYENVMKRIINKYGIALTTLKKEHSDYINEDNVDNEDNDYDWNQSDEDKAILNPFAWATTHQFYNCIDYFQNNLRDKLKLYGQNMFINDILKDKECPVLLTPLKRDESILLDCKHLLSKEALHKMEKKECPLCRATIRSNYTSL